MLASRTKRERNPQRASFRTKPKEDLTVANNVSRVPNTCTASVISAVGYSVLARHLRSTYGSLLDGTVRSRQERWHPSCAEPLETHRDIPLRNERCCPFIFLAVRGRGGASIGYDVPLVQVSSSLGLVRPRCCVLFLLSVTFEIVLIEQGDSP